MTNDKFDPKKLMTIQDPKAPGRHRSLYNFAKDNADEESKEETKKPAGSVVEQSGTQRRILDSLKQDGGLGATRELKEKYRNNPAFMIDDDNDPNKRVKTSCEATNVFKLPPRDEK